MGQSRKSKRRSRISQRGGVADYPAAFQSKAELAQFGPLPDNTWASGLGQNPGLNDQMTADTGGYHLVSGGSRNRRSRSRKLRQNKNY
jgi:hypothetical protein